MKPTDNIINVAKLKREAKRKANAKFNAIARQNKMIDDKGVTALDGRKAKKDNQNTWIKRHSNTVDYRYYKPSKNKPVTI